MTVHEVGEWQGRHFIVTEFIDGITLRTRMRRRRLPLADALDIAAQIAGALSAAHGAGIVHRDIKPENVMLRPDGLVKILDFGIAKFGAVSELSRREALVKTSPGEIIGTAAYMSPEQARGQPVDARTDIWSLGAILYEMVTHRLPFPGATPTDRIAAILEREPAPLRKQPADLQRIIDHTLAKQKENRYDDTADLADELKRLRATLRDRPLARLALPVPMRRFNRLSRAQMALAVFLISLLAAVAILGFVYFPRSSQPSQIDSIAVLPLNASGNQEAEYLSDGITQTLINSLSQLPNMKVIARTSTARYKGRQVDPQKVASELGVVALLSGNLVQRDDHLEIDLELMDARNNSHVWGERYRRKVSDVLQLQSDISRDVSDRLRSKLSGEEKSQIAKRYTENAEAYRLYLQGRYFSDKLTREDCYKAIDFFKRAIALDPNYALAYAGLADGYYCLSNLFMPPREVMPSAEAAARKALGIDEKLAEGHVSLGTIEMYYEWDWTAAEREFHRAIELNPNFAIVYLRYGMFLSAQGRFDEGHAKLRRALELDPFSHEINAFLAIHYLTARKFDQAVEQARKAVAMDPNFWLAHDFLGSAYQQKGDHAAAFAEWQKAIQLHSNPSTLAKLASGYALVGRKAEAIKILKELLIRSKQSYVSPYFVAIIYAGLGEKDQAFAWLEKTYEDRNEMIIWLMTDPPFDNLHSDPRFDKLMQRIRMAPR